MKGLIRIDVLISLFVVSLMVFGTYFLLPLIVNTAYQLSTPIVKAMEK